jgi:hypothetical protein
MPLSFESLSHGSIAFGFFNIESDMLLLEGYFFFATDFCEWMGEIAGKKPDADLSASWPVFHIASRQDVGDLMGAIHGLRHVGFLGDTYLAYPFPKAREDFKQNPSGDSTQAEFTRMVEKYAVRMDLEVTTSHGDATITLGEIAFARSSFQELVRYVWRGGYPKWRDERPPAYVKTMREALERSEHWLFEGIAFDP